MRLSCSRRWLVPCLTAVFVVVLGVLGCQSERPRTVGQAGQEAKVETDNQSSLAKTATETEEQSISSLNEAMVGKTVAVRGEITQQCPSTGCWFQVKDGTGELFVDLNSTDVRIKERRVGQHAEVSGKLVKRGGELQLVAERVKVASKE